MQEMGYVALVVKTGSIILEPYIFQHIPSSL